MLGRAGEAGQKQRLAAAAQGNITYRSVEGLVLPGTESDGGAETKANQSKTTRAIEPRMGESVPTTSEQAAGASGFVDAEAMT